MFVCSFVPVYWPNASVGFDDSDSDVNRFVIGQPLTGGEIVRRLFRRRPPKLCIKKCEFVSTI